MLDTKMAGGKPADILSITPIGVSSPTDQDDILVSSPDSTTPKPFCTVQKNSDPSWAQRLPIDPITRHDAQADAAIALLDAGDLDAALAVLGLAEVRSR